MARHERILYALITGFLFACILAGFLSQGLGDTMSGIAAAQLHEARLINDYTLAVGDGAAVVNASLVALIGLVLIRINRVSLSGPTIAAVFTMFGFGLFGKTPLNAIPIIAGVYLSARWAGKSFNEYILIALFGTALGPLVTLVLVETGLSIGLRIPMSVVAGLIAGLMLPPAAMAMLRMHQGFNLYNIGLTSGFLGLFFAAVLSAAGLELTPGAVWNTGPSHLLIWIVPGSSAFMIVSGLLISGKGTWKGLNEILKSAGRLPTDFVDIGGVGSTLVNMGLMGSVFWIYCFFIKADLNGPVLGGLYTIIGFAAFGKHLKNTLPVVAGVIGAALLFGMPLTSPGVILAALFCTTLAPLTGEFGIPVGVTAGILHLLMVSRTGSWHSWIDLYNNGFAGGLTATLMVALIEWNRTNKESKPVSSTGRKE